MDSKLISELGEGDVVVSFAVVRRKEIRTKRDSVDTYLSLELGDRSGRITASMWQEFADIAESIEVGDVVKVRGNVVRVRDRLYLNIERLRVANEGDAVDLSQLIPMAERDREEMWRELEGFIESIESTPLKRLLQEIFGRPRIKELFIDRPGGKHWHHAYVGGLLEHTLSVTTICARLAPLYEGADRDLVVAAGLLHDIGKVHSYLSFPTFDFTDEGRLIGHIVIGSQMVAEAISGLPDFPPELSKRLQHLILSHQGKLEQASPVVPMMLEGLILYYADELDSKANAFLRIRDREKRPGTRWSGYINLIGRHLYFGE